MNRINKIIVLVFLVIATLEAEAQTFSIEGGIGIGNVLETSNSQPKGILSIGANYHFSDKLDFGIGAETGGNFFPFETEVDFQGDQRVLNPSDFKFETISLNAKYHFFKFWNTRVYVGLSAGYSNYFRHINGERITDRNLIVIPELGLEIYNVNIGLKYYTKANTPSFRTTDTLLESNKYSMLVLRASYRIKFGK